MGFKLEVLPDTPRVGTVRVRTINEDTSSYHATDVRDGAAVAQYMSIYTHAEVQNYEEHHAFAHSVAVNREAQAQQHSLAGVKVPDWLRRHATFMYQEGYTCTAPDMMFDWFQEYHPNASVARSDCSEFIRRFA